MDLTLILGSTKFAAYVTKKQIFQLELGPLVSSCNMCRKSKLKILINIF